MNNVDHPKHYQGATKGVRGLLLMLGVPANLMDGECIDAIEHINAGFHLGNAIKYLWRAEQKGKPKEDLEKARWYLDRIGNREHATIGTISVGEVINLIDMILERLP